MSKLIAEDLTIYKIRTKDFNEKNLANYDVFVSGSSPKEIFYCVIKNGSKGTKKFLNSIAEDKLSIDKLFSANQRRAEKLDNLLPEDIKHEIQILTEDKIKKRIEDSFKNLIESKVSKKDLKRYANEILDLAKSEWSFVLRKYDVLFLSQLTDKGWVSSQHLYFSPTHSYVKQIKISNLVKVKSFEGTQSYFVKLTKEGKKIQEKVFELSKQYVEIPDIPEGALPLLFQ